jgi:hypothetical protein
MNEVAEEESGKREQVLRVVRGSLGQAAVTRLPLLV